MKQKLINICKRLILRKSKEQIELEYLIDKGLKIGKNCHIYSTSTIDGAWPWLIDIGDNVTISTNVTILAHDASTNVAKCSTKLGRVNIGNNVFIGTGSIVLCNTRIGNNVVVAAGSVVTKDLPDDGVYAGTPAKRICTIQEYSEKYTQLKSIRPDFSEIRPWYDWTNATDSEKEDMITQLENQEGFV